MSTATLKLLSKAQILSAVDIVTEDVPTPEWAPDQVPTGEGDAVRPITPEERAEYGVRIRNLTGSGRGVFIQKSLEMKAKESRKEKVDFEIEILMVAMTACDADGNRIFTEDDVAALGSRNANPISRCAAVAARLAGLDQVAQANAAKQ